MDLNGSSRNRLQWLMELWKGLCSWGLFLLLPSVIILWFVTQEKPRSRKTESVRATNEENPVPLLPIRAMSLSADGQYVDVMRSDAIWYRHDAHSGEELGQRSLPNPKISQVKIRSEGGLIMGINHQDQLEVFNDSTVLWQGPLPEQQPGECVRNGSLCQERGLAAAVSEDGSLWVLEFDGSRLISCDHHILETGLSSAAISPSGDRIALVTLGRELLVWDALLKQVVLQASADQVACLFASWSGDGRRLITYGYDREVQVWRADSLESIQQWRINFQLVQDAKLSFDGRLAVIADQELISLRDVDSGLTQAELAGHRSLVTTLQFADQGRTLFSADNQGRIHRWSVTDQRSIWSTP